MNIDLSLRKIKNIQNADLSLPFEKGLYALVGENGCGKSTLMLALSFMVKTSSAHMLKLGDIDPESKIEIAVNGHKDNWYFNPKRNELTTGKFQKRGEKDVLVASTHIEGFYEGSIFYGCRFDDYNVIDAFMQDQNFIDLLTDADSFVIETLGFILHNDKTYYKKLKRIKNRSIAQAHGFKGIPYFMDVGSHIISQYKMSSGESMLISLIDFLNNVIIKNPRRKDHLLFLIDEVELALHPSAIDRLVLFLDQLIKDTSSELIIYFSTHSAELIHRIDAKHIFLIENINGDISIINPCYPNYAVRNLYVPNGFDFLLLVEDKLAKCMVNKIIRDDSLAQSKLCCVLLAGGWSQMLRLHKDMITYNTLGVGKHIISIFDGDVKEDVSKKSEYNSLPKCFLPISSIEKYLYKKCILESDQKFIKLIGDKYFGVRSLKNIIEDYKSDDRTKKSADNDGKGFYSVVTTNLLISGIAEDAFVTYLCDDICNYEDITSFRATLKKLLC